MEDCIFCKIINREIPSHVVYEDEDVLAFLDITQVTKGHTLLIPKKHVSDIFEYDQNLAATLFSRIPKIAKAIESSDNLIKGMNIVNNNREVAYQTVFHSHVHLIPRYDKKDDFSMRFGNHMEDYSAAELATLARSIQAHIK
ncbi:HIT family protein [Carnobacterium gallinarum]|uniref:HIT family protein n=1 Tax=Carnobacterium gallinarum TaxID=2749 RepID=UPI00054D5F96|nr:HIT family protein [Carnobacterium gallinarum]